MPQLSPQEEFKDFSIIKDSEGKSVSFPSKIEKYGLDLFDVGKQSTLQIEKKTEQSNQTEVVTT